ncbi:hypothetical protein TWF730_006009 [Orbilia blumenaviensis]|uniref:Secreted protein n=1 Tax=Orbilia blumenaviensis TaxID=1796055 RepID=A0AAV9VKD3_9PEZI
MKHINPITLILSLTLPTSLTSLAIPAHAFQTSPPPSPTTKSNPPSDVTSASLNTGNEHQKRDPPIPASLRDVLHRARPPEDLGSNGSRPPVTARSFLPIEEPNVDIADLEKVKGLLSAIAKLNIDIAALERAKAGITSPTGDGDAGAPPPPPAPPPVPTPDPAFDAHGFKKNIIRL